MIIYFRIHQLLLENSLRQQNASEKEINEIFGFLRGVGPSKGKLSTATAGGGGGTSGGLLKRVWGGKDDFTHNYNIQIDRSNALRKARGQPLLKRWGEKTAGASGESEIGKSGGGGSDDPSTPYDPTVRASMQSAVAAQRYQRGASGKQAERDKLAAELKAKRGAKTGDEAHNTLKDAALKRENDAIDAENLKLARAGITNKPKKTEVNMGMLDKGQRGELRRSINAPLLQQLAARKKDLSSTYYGDVANLIRESFQINEKKGPCWKGYEAVGMKMKGGRRVPNCVPKKK